MRKRRYFTQPEMEDVRDRWENGEPLNSIARIPERGHSAVQGMLSRTGGIRPERETLTIFGGLKNVALLRHGNEHE